MSDKPRVFLIVPAYGHYDYVQTTVRSAIECMPDIFVMVIDDASPMDEFIDASLSLQSQQIGWMRFDNNGGLTRSWNAGLKLSRDMKFEYTICGNSDLVFAPGWWDQIQAALDAGWALAGPVSNAAGTTIGCRQGILNYLPDYAVSDKPEDIAATAFKLRAKGPPIDSPLNGFCLCAKTSVWWANAFDDQHVFDPAFPMVLNEDRLQARWRRKGLKFCVCPKSFVLHYRSVSRGPRHVHGQWLRKKGAE